MVIVRLKGGLGNQLYQYAYGLYLTDKYNVTLIIDATYFHIYPKIKEVTPRDFELEKILKVKEQTITLKKYSLLKSKVTYYVIQAAIRLKYKLKLVKDDTEDAENSLKLKKNIYLDGYFQRAYEDAFVEKNILPIIKDDFMKSDNFNSIIEKIQNTQSVSIHVRRGDYLKAVNSKFQGVCTEEYYFNAIADIQRKVSNPLFLIFSDDLEWCKQTFSRISNTHFVDINKGNKSYRDIILMSLCKHNIIANSTFSEWGAILNQNKNSILIKPKK